MLNVLVGLIADNVLVKYDVHSARLNDGNELVFFLKNRLINETPETFTNQTIVINICRRMTISVIWVRSIRLIKKVAQFLCDELDLQDFSVF